MRYLTPDSTPRVRPSMFLHGLTGAGKSTWATTGGTPLVILTEPKAESVLRQVNPNAIGIVPESLDDLEQLLVILGNPEKTAKFDRIVLDSFTELTLAAPRWIQARAGRSGVVAKLDISEFGNLRDYALAMVKAIQLTGLPSVILGRSTSKRVGPAERIVPDGMGRSVEDLPGKLLPTAEARFDPELGYVIDTTPSDYSQRCGLPWLPTLWQGSCIDFLALVERGLEGAPEQPMPTTHPAPTAHTPDLSAGADDPEWVDMLAQCSIIAAKLGEEPQRALVNEWGRLYTQDPAAAKQAAKDYLASQPDPTAPNPETQPAEYQQAFGEANVKDLVEKRAAAKAAPADPAAQAFVDGISPECAKPEDITEMHDLCRFAKVNLDSLWLHAIRKGGAKATPDGSVNWLSLNKSYVVQILNQLKGKNKPAFITFLHQTYPVTK